MLVPQHVPPPHLHPQENGFVVYGVSAAFSDYEIPDKNGVEWHHVPPLHDEDMRRLHRYLLTAEVDEGHFANALPHWYLISLNLPSVPCTDHWDWVASYS